MTNTLHEAITTLETAIQEHRGELKRMEDGLATLKGLKPDPPPPPSTEFYGRGLKESAERWLKQMGTPQRTRDITDALLAGGYRTKAQNPVANVHATLAQDKQVFVKTAEGLWDLVKRS